MFSEFEGKNVTEILTDTLKSPYTYIGLAVGYALCHFMKKKGKKY